MARGDLRRTRDQRLVLVGKSSRMKNVVGMREVRKMEVPAEPKAMMNGMDCRRHKALWTRAVIILSWLSFPKVLLVVAPWKEHLSLLLLGGRCGRFGEVKPH
ncbi:hypothetical protein F2Q69_00059859 [Brassica cretica]|uniref:Uncharacterized protein n=1 Tax=Brassica cretica TaxID=69181 RepID=A0A8S9RJ47_BRACR|nr:hypothetical protein F2Q69_00059859 [Brassica cretica]